MTLFPQREIIRSVSVLSTTEEGMSTIIIHIKVTVSDFGD